MTSEQANANVMKPNYVVELTLTDACNCNCKYCFEGLTHCGVRNTEEEERQFNIILNSIKQFDKSKYLNFVISFWGGEPFMNTEFMYKIINATYCHDFVCYNMFSNGTLVDKYEDFLSLHFIDAIKKRLSIQLSFDGIPIHNEKRGNNIDLIMYTSDLLFNKGISFLYKSTVPLDMIDCMSLVWDSYYALFLRYGDIVKYSPTLDTTCKNQRLIDEKLDVFKQQILDICKKEYAFYRKHNHFLMTVFNGDKKNCDIRNSVFMHTDGNIYYCHGCPYAKNKDDFKICKTADISASYEVNNDYMMNIDRLCQTCKNCSATHCGICHVLYIDDDKVIESWANCRLKNKMCKYYKAFGALNKLLVYGLKY